MTIPNRFNDNPRREDVAHHLYLELSPRIRRYTSLLQDHPLQDLSPRIEQAGELGHRLESILISDTFYQRERSDQLTLPWSLSHSAGVALGGRAG